MHRPALRETGIHRRVDGDVLPGSATIGGHDPPVQVKSFTHVATALTSGMGEFENQ